MRKIDLVGQTFGRLTVIGSAPNTRKGGARWLCHCSCGKEVIVRSETLRNGMTKSCGCWHSEVARAKHTTHGMTGTHIYGTWNKMMQRCESLNDRAYFRYGGRGITVCPSWHAFENFYADMGEPPTPEHQLDRIDNDGPYSPENCQWATPKMQANNRSNGVYASWNGKTQTLAQWADETGLAYHVIYYRIVLSHWPVERALTAAVRKAR